MREKFELTAEWYSQTACSFKYVRKKPSRMVITRSLALWAILASLSALIIARLLKSGLVKVSVAVAEAFSSTEYKSTYKCLSSSCIEDIPDNPIRQTLNHLILQTYFSIQLFQKLLVVGICVYVVSSVVLMQSVQVRNQKFTMGCLGRKHFESEVTRNPVSSKVLQRSRRSQLSEQWNYK